jgi:hypothetical protein
VNRVSRPASVTINFLLLLNLKNLSIGPCSDLVQLSFNVILPSVPISAMLVGYLEILVCIYHVPHRCRIVVSVSIMIFGEGHRS